MNSYHDPELDDVLQDDELRHIASVLKASTIADPPLDDAFRTGLRRQLMNEAWALSEGRESWWRRAFAPPGLAWAGAAAGMLIIASVVVYTTLNQSGGFSQQVQIQSPLDGNRSVALQQPILVAFNQPMDHQATESAVQITPATTVTYTWANDSKTLAVQPTGGALAPNTQYQVTIGPGAKTATGRSLTAPQTITFVTQPPATPPAPTPRPTPSAALGEKQLASLNGASGLDAQWSADSASLYYVDGKGALRVAPVSGGGTPDVIATDSASSPAISPTGDHLAYIRDGKIEVLTFASGKTDELDVTPTPVLVAWAKNKLVWAGAGALYTQASDGSTQQLVALPTTGTVTVVAISQDGAHAVFTQDQNLFLLDTSSGKSLQLGPAGAVFQGWSPGGSELLYATADNVIVSDMQGVTQATLPSGEASWSGQDAILIGGDTDVLEARPDGSNLGKIANGTFHTPSWAPNGTTFVFVRGGSIWTATAPALPPQPTALDDATAVVNTFMQDRVAGASDQATALLDDNGKAAYGTGGLSLLVTGDPHLSRSYILTSEIVSTAPDTARFVVRLVLTHGKLDVSDYEETLTLVRNPTTRQFLIDQATAAPTRNLGGGAQVVSVDVTSDTVRVTFDSDLDPATVTGAVTIVDAKGNPVNVTVSYANRVVTLSGLNLKEGDHFRLVVSTGLRDIQGNSVASEYDLDLVGPSAKRHIDHQGVITAGPAASPAVRASSTGG